MTSNATYNITYKYNTTYNISISLCVCVCVCLQAELVGVTKLHLLNTGPPGWYSLLDPAHPDTELRSRVLIGLTLLVGGPGPGQGVGVGEGEGEETQTQDEGRVLGFMRLAGALPPPAYPHLYLGFDWAALAALGAPLLPALKAEVVLDRRDNVHVRPACVRVCACLCVCACVYVYVYMCMCVS
jgi:hypothetical protein